MRKVIYTLYLCLVIVLSGAVISKTANAFFIKSDIEQAVSRITSWIQTMKEKCQEVIEGIQSSQFGQFVGEGVKNTKKAIKFAEEKYGEFQEVKGRILSSEEYKAAELSAQIAKKTAEIQSLKDEKVFKQEEIKAELDLLKEQTEAKINIVQENLAAIEAEISLMQGDSSGATKSIDVSDEEMRAIETEIANINSAYTIEAGLLNDELSALEDEYTSRITELEEEIQKLSEQLVNLSKKFNKEKKKKKKTEEALNETYNNYTTQSTTVSIKEEKEIRRRRQKAIQEKNSSIIAEASVKRGEIYDAKDEVDKKQRLSSTMPGEAEGSVIIGQVLSEQIDSLRKFIELAIADLEVQTTMAVGQLQDITIPKMPEKFNLCDYSTKDLAEYKSYENNAEDKNNTDKGTLDQGEEGANAFDQEIDEDQGETNLGSMF